MAGSGPVSALRQSLTEYLAVRTALGYRLERTEKLLGQFLDYLHANGPDRITVEHAVAWAILPRSRAALARDAPRRGPRICALRARSRPASRGARGGPAARQVRS